MLATIERITEVFAHPQAQKLDVAVVLGYDCVIAKDSFKTGDTVVFIQPDTVLPKDKAWTEPYLKYAPTRVKATKLNSKFTIWSQGIIVDLSELAEFNLLKYPIGTEISDIIGVTKYEPPVRYNGTAGLPFGIPKTDEERWENLRNIPFGVTCDVTRKIDGSSCTFYYDLKTDKFGITSRSIDLKLPREFSLLEQKVQKLLFFLSKFKRTKFIGNHVYKLVNYLTNKLDLSIQFTDNEFTRIAEQLNIEPKLRKFCQENKISLALRGEVYGNGINASKPNLDAKKPLGFALFSVYKIDTHEYAGSQSAYYFTKVAEMLDIPTADVLESNVELTPQLIEKYKLADVIEGVVINFDDGLKRQSFKVLSVKYDQAK